ncbi:MAG: hypothetical protein LOD87_07655, partial [Planifilum fulgidum]
MRLPPSLPLNFRHLGIRGNTAQKNSLAHPADEGYWPNIRPLSPVYVPASNHMLKPGPSPGFHLRHSCGN